MTPEQALQVKALRTRSDRSEIFNYVIDHLRKQGERSVFVAGAEVCAYRGVGGTMCAVGALIADDEYNPKWENKSVDQLLDQNLLPPRLKHQFFQDLAMLEDLQHFHDHSLEFENGVFSKRAEACVKSLRDKWLGYPVGVQTPHS